LKRNVGRFDAAQNAGNELAGGISGFVKIPADADRRAAFDCGGLMQNSGKRARLAALDDRFETEMVRLSEI
jgi:hypothetical protein